MDFRDLDFVEALGGVGCLDVVGLKVSCSNAVFLVL